MRFILQLRFRQSNNNLSQANIIPVCRASKLERVLRRKRAWLGQLRSRRSERFQVSRAKFALILKGDSNHGANLAGAIKHW